MSSRNKVGALAIAMAALFGPAANAAIVTNGGFETGDFTGWTQTGNASFNGVQCPGPASVFAGNCDAFFGAVGSPGGISQNLSTIAGEQYNISFAFDPDGGVPSTFSAFFGATQLISLTNPADSPFALMSFNAYATSGSTALSFNFRDDPGFAFLDAVSVTDVPEPVTLTIFGTGLVGVIVMRRRKAKSA